MIWGTMFMWMVLCLYDSLNLCVHDLGQYISCDTIFTRRLCYGWRFIQIIQMTVSIILVYRAAQLCFSHWSFINIECFSKLFYLYNELDGVLLCEVGSRTSLYDITVSSEWRIGSHLS